MLLLLLLESPPGGGGSGDGDRSTLLRSPPKRSRSTVIGAVGGERHIPSPGWGERGRGVANRTAGRWDGDGERGDGWTPGGPRSRRTRDRGATLPLAPAATLNELTARRSADQISGSPAQHSTKGPFAPERPPNPCVPAGTTRTRWCGIVTSYTAA